MKTGGLVVMVLGLILFSFPLTAQAAGDSLNDPMCTAVVPGQLQATVNGVETYFTWTPSGVSWTTNGVASSTVFRVTVYAVDGTVRRIWGESGSYIDGAVARLTPCHCPLPGATTTTIADTTSTTVPDTTTSTTVPDTTTTTTVPDTTTTTVPDTTTTVPDTTTTSTTVPDTTTTVPDTTTTVPDTTTTSTTVPDTTTTVPDTTTTSTTVPDTTTSTLFPPFGPPGSSTTTPAVVLGTTVTTSVVFASAPPAETLPLTGLDSQFLALIGLLLVVGGAGLVASSRATVRNQSA